MSAHARAAAAELEAWAAENKDLLRLVWESFDHEGEWPQAAELIRPHFASRPRRDYADIARLMPPQLGRLDLLSDGRIMLTPRDWPTCPLPRLCCRRS